jgi:N-acetylmuramoyl-L-alanine amidase
MAYQIVLDAGHGGYDDGAIYNDRLEKDDNLNLALAVGDILAYNGMDVILTRIDDTFISPLERAYMANSEEADLFVSIHRNSGDAINAYSGVQTFIYDEDKSKEDIANAIATAILDSIRYAEDAAGPAYRVQVGLFRVFENAQSLQSILTEMGYDVVLLPQGEYYAVQVGEFTNMEEAEELEQELIEQGYSTMIVSV